VGVGAVFVVRTSLFLAWDIIVRHASCFLYLRSTTINVQRMLLRRPFDQPLSRAACVAALIIIVCMCAFFSVHRILAPVAPLLQAVPDVRFWSSWIVEATFGKAFRLCTAGFGLVLRMNECGGLVSWLGVAAPSCLLAPLLGTIAAVSIGRDVRAKIRMGLSITAPALLFYFTGIHLVLAVAVFAFCIVWGSLLVTLGAVLLLVLMMASVLAVAPAIFYLGLLLLCPVLLTHVATPACQACIRTWTASVVARREASASARTATAQAAARPEIAVMTEHQLGRGRTEAAAAVQQAPDPEGWELINAAGMETDPDLATWDIVETQAEAAHAQPPQSAAVPQHEQGLPALGACAVCAEDMFPEHSLFAIPVCSHLFHTHCIIGYLHTCMGNAAEQFPVRCPNGINGCTGMITSQSVQHLCGFVHHDPVDGNEITFTQEDYDRFVRFADEANIVPAERVHCANPRCACILRPRAAALLHVINSTRRSEFAMQCGQCHTLTCGRCALRSHQGLSCTEARRLHQEREAETALLIRQTSKPCPQCGTAITHYRGHACHHIRGCPKCKTHFCYACLGRYTANRTRTCRCIMFCRDGACDCPDCPDCRPGQPCGQCDGDRTCRSCHPRGS
jgi:hypothetical protein